jgi:AraC-like DNA-binding protein
MIGHTSRASVQTNKGRAPYRIETARQILHDSFSRNVSVSDIALAVDMHPVYLATEFRRYFKSTIGEYIRHLRVESACDRLAHTTLPMVEIALLSGFSSQSHFCRVFKRLTGTTPGHYRSSNLF